VTWVTWVTWAGWTTAPAAAWWPLRTWTRWWQRRDRNSTASGWRWWSPTTPAPLRWPTPLAVTGRLGSLPVAEVVLRFTPDRHPGRPGIHPS